MMKCCQDHWQKLRAAIDGRGLSQLVSPHGLECARRMQDEIDNGMSPQNFDPLMSAHNMIIANALKAGGTYLLGPDQHGQEYCPLCEVDAHQKELGENADTWIEHAADGCLEWAAQNGLLARN